jgi:DNA repair protein RadC
MQICDTPKNAVDYWRMHVATSRYFNPECECFVVLILNTRKRIRGHQLISIGTLDCTIMHPRDAFRAAIGLSASAIIAMHNHPSGEPSPSGADVRSTQELIKAGQILKIEVLDHIIVGNPTFCSLREMGFLKE